MRATTVWLMTGSVLACGMGMVAAQSPGDMTFFVTSVGSGRGGDLGGLEGADRHCQNLAAAAGAGNRVWRAYLSTSGPDAVNARDRIGTGPWRNARGIIIAENLAQFHGENAINLETALTEKGQTVPGVAGRGSTHDMLTGSTAGGRAFAPDRGDRTCSNWSSSGSGVATVGHHDRAATTGNSEEDRSWNSAHRSRGCSLGALGQTSGAGLFYCFAAGPGN